MHSSIKVFIFSKSKDTLMQHSVHQVDGWRFLSEDGKKTTKLQIKKTKKQNLAYNRIERETNNNWRNWFSIKNKKTRTLILIFWGFKSEFWEIKLKINVWDVAMMFQQLNPSFPASYFGFNILDSCNFSWFERKH